MDKMEMIKNFKNGTLSIRDIYNYFNKDLKKTLKEIKTNDIDLLDCDIEEIEKIKKEVK